MPQTVTILPTLVHANQFAATAARSLNASTKGRTVSLTDTNGTWPVAEDPTRHIICWGVQILRGADWKWWFCQGDTGSTGFMADGEDTVRQPNVSLWENFGIRDHLGNVNLSITVTPTYITANVGDQVRLGILLDADYTFGATITVT